MHARSSRSAAAVPARRIKPAALFLFAMFALALFPAALGGQARAAQSGLNDDYLAPVTPAAYRVQVAMAEPLGRSGLKQDFADAVRNNLSYLPFMRVQAQAAIPGGTDLPAASGPDLDFSRFRLAKTDNLLTFIWVGARQVEGRVYEVETGRFVFGSRLDIADSSSVFDAADEFCAQYMESITGRGDFFRSMLAFSKGTGARKRDIWICKPTGGSLRQLTNIPGLAISPTWSHDGRFVVFSHIDEQSHAMGVWDSTTNRVQRLRFPGNTVIGPCFMPDNKVAVSLTDGRNPNIYLLDHSFKKEKTLISSWSIDVSPSVDASGASMVYTSSRQGNPHIFITNLKTGQTRRVSRDGKYNTDPSISPDGTLVAFARQMGSQHRIFIHDLRTGEERQITFGPGSDEQPEFAPDSYFLAFTSSRSGVKRIYLTTRHGSEPRMLETGSGDASFPTWGLR